MSNLFDLIPDVKVGDRLRVTVEGEVNHLSDAFVSIPGFDFDDYDKNVVAAEILPPPVETFGPGDVIRHKASGDRYAIPDEPNKVLCLSPGTYLGRILPCASAHLTSEYYERVSL